jgi:sulfite reductase beta subunit-like hemoprotein
MVVYRHIKPHPAQRELFQKDMETLRGAISRYRNKEMSEDEFRPIRLSFGIYAQLPHVTYMSRIKIPAGRITSIQFRKLAEIAQQYAHGEAHVTTRQDIQFHFMPLEKMPDLFEELFEIGINTRGACYDGARNVKCDPFSGLDPEEPFFVAPYALAVTDFYYYNERNLKLPRKYKISFSSTPEDRGQVFIDDLGFIATRTERGEGFRVFLGGGLGAYPIPPMEVIPFLPKEDTLIAAEAAIRLFYDLGNRKDRRHARLKFVKKALGPEKFQKTFLDYFRKVEEEIGEELRRELVQYVNEFQEPSPHLPPEDPKEPYPPDLEEWASTNTFRQKQRGYLAVILKLPLGDVNHIQMIKIAEIADEYGNGTLRLSPTQKIIIPFIPASRLPDIYATLRIYGLAEGGAGLISDVVSCPGADYCSLAVAKSRGVGSLIRENLRGGSVAEKLLGPFHIRISGCPNSCGQHHVGDIGLTGMMVTDASGKEYPHWGIMVGGKVGPDGRHAIRLKYKIPERLAPIVVAQIANDYLENREDGEPFYRYVERKGKEHFERIALSVLGSTPKVP